MYNQIEHISGHIIRIKGMPAIAGTMIQFLYSFLVIWINKMPAVAGNIERYYH